MAKKYFLSRLQAAIALCLALLLFQAGCENPATTPDLAVLYPPPNPGPSLTAGDGYLQVQFTKVASAVSYRIYYNTSENPAGALSVDVKQPENQLVECLIQPLTNGQTYWVWAEARFSDARSELSASDHAAPRAKPQSPPAAFDAYPNDGSLDLTWSLASDADSYVVYYNTTGGAVPPDDSAWVEFQVDKTYAVMGLVTGLDNSTSYNLWIRAKNSSGESAGYTPKAAVTPVSGGGAPQTPVISLLKAGHESIIVEWEAVQRATGYKIYYNTSNTTSGAAEKSVPAGYGLMRESVTGLTNKTGYWIWVAAMNGSAESAVSSVKTATPQPKPDLNMNDRLMRLGSAESRFPNEEAGKGDRLSRKQETALGDLVADAMLYWANKHKTEHGISANIDFTIVNGGVIVGALARGPITVGDVNRFLHPEGDKMSILTMTGSQIMTLFKDHVAKVRHDGGGGNGTGGFGQVSKKVRYTINYHNDSRGGVLEDFTFDGQPLEDGKSYTFVTSTYLVDNGDGYGPYLLTDSKTNTGKQINEAVAEWIYNQNEVPIKPETDGRILLRNAVWK
ncbi:MAG: 5'-nucleotidase C-terminal domain-containing protein [Spirochaetaceae bacterium]|nr:5'-nucleotidase C-terminal domain-containing protein [Spirochaetaceae bacterium]